MKDFRKISPNRLRHYCALDTAATLELYRWQKPRMGPFLETWHRLEQPALAALARVERWGAILDRDNVMRYDAFLKAKVARLQEDFRRFPEIPADFNVKSPPQMAKVLGGTLKLKSPFKTKAGNPSWGDEALEELTKQEGAPACLSAIRDMLAARSMISSYGEGQLKNVGFDGRVHTTYKFARTGRLRSSEPNLQNLKKEDDTPDLADEDNDGLWARSCWVCPPGWVWLNLDYSQLELRVAAILSGDRAMTAAFLSGYDFHDVRAREMFKVDSMDVKVTKEQRRAAKVVGFMIPYGATAHGVSQAKGMRGNVTVERTQEYIDAYLASAPDLDVYLREQVVRASRTGDALVSYKGWTRRRPVIDIGEQGDEKAVKKRVSHAERVSKNMPIQFVANAFALTGLARVVSWIDDVGAPAEVVMTVHDSLGLYVREDAWKDVARECVRMMTDFDSGPLPLKVDVEKGDHDLGHMEKVKPADYAA